MADLDPRVTALARALLDVDFTDREPADIARDLLAVVDGLPDAEVIAAFPLPADWETVERMLNAVWKDGPEWSGANTVAGSRWTLTVRDGALVVLDNPRPS